MSRSVPGKEERRRCPRFSCAGVAHINRLPSNGILIPGRMRDLSLGGCCIDTSQPIDSGDRAELIVRVNAASFRVLGEVRAIRGASCAGMEFVQLSAGGRQMLSELCTDLAKLESVMNALKAMRHNLEGKTCKEKWDVARTIAKGSLSPSCMSLLSESLCAEQDSDAVPDNLAAGERISAAQPVVITIDVFG